MERRIEDLIRRWQRRNIEGFYCNDRQEAADKILDMIPVGNSVGISGSVTLDQLGIVKLLESRGSQVFNQYKVGLSRQESLEIRRQGIQAEYYLASANAVSEKGELVFFSSYGNRTAGIAYAKQVIAVCGLNKIVANIEEALRRVRAYATPRNCKRLQWNTPCLKEGICQEEICLFPDFQRMCCQILIIEAEVLADRLKVIIVGEALGY